MKWFDALASVALALMMALLVVTLWATDKSVVRTACYRTAKQVSDCPPPGRAEQFLRDWLP